MDQARTILEFEVTNVAIGESLLKWIIPQPLRFQGVAPSLFYVKMSQPRFETMEPFFPGVVSHVEKLKVNVKVRIQRLGCFPDVDRIEATKPRSFIVENQALELLKEDINSTPQTRDHSRIHSTFGDLARTR